MFQYSAMVISGDEDVSLLPFTGEKHIYIYTFLHWIAVYKEHVDIYHKIYLQGIQFSMLN